MTRFIAILDIDDDYPGSQLDVADWLTVGLIAEDRTVDSVVYAKIEDFDLDRAEKAGPFAPGYRAGDLISFADRGSRS